jgi:hypothetical protein
MMIDPFELPDAASARYAGPFERVPWPSRLVARVVGLGDGNGAGAAEPEERRINGYAVAADLARHHGPVETAWLALRGELPTTAERAALAAALVLLAPVHIGEAPAHAAYLGRMAGGAPATTVAIGAIGCAEQAAHEHRALAPWRAWLEGGGGPVPEVACAATGASAWRIAQADLDVRMREWFGGARGLPEVMLRRVACAHAILVRLGAADELAYVTLATMARLPAVIAEAAHARAGDFRDYPTRLPDYRYVDDEGAAP